MISRPLSLLHLSSWPNSRSLFELVLVCAVNDRFRVVRVLWSAATAAAADSPMTTVIVHAYFCAFIIQCPERRTYLLSTGFGELELLEFESALTRNSF